MKLHVCDIVRYKFLKDHYSYNETTDLERRRAWNKKTTYEDTVLSRNERW